MMNNIFATLKSFIGSSSSSGSSSSNSEEEKRRANSVPNSPARTAWTQMLDDAPGSVDRSRRSSGVSNGDKAQITASINKLSFWRSSHEMDEEEQEEDSAKQHMSEQKELSSLTFSMSLPASVKSPASMSSLALKPEKWMKAYITARKGGSLSDRKTLKALVRSGIPAPLRSKIWMDLAGVPPLLKQFPGLYAKLLNANVESGNEEVIIRDLHRTLPHHDKFRVRGGEGQQALYRVLKAYSVFDKKVGYAQGMAFFAATLLLHMKEEEAFWFMVRLMGEFQLDTVFGPGVPLLLSLLETASQLVSRYLPLLHERLKSLCIGPEVYAGPFILSLFAGRLQQSVVERIWDSFFLSGWKSIFACIIAFLKLQQEDLLSCPVDDMMKHFHQYCVTVDSDELLRVAFSLGVKNKALPAPLCNHNMKLMPACLLEMDGSLEAEDIEEQEYEDKQSLLQPFDVISPKKKEETPKPAVKTRSAASLFADFEEEEEMEKEKEKEKDKESSQRADIVEEEKKEEDVIQKEPEGEQQHSDVIIEEKQEKIEEAREHTIEKEGADELDVVSPQEAAPFQRAAV